MTANTARTNLLINGEPLPWPEWATEFREHIPDEINQLVEEVAAGSGASDHSQSIRDRLKQIRDLLRISRYRPAKDGAATIDPDAAVGGASSSRDRGEERQTGSGKPGGRGGRGGDIYTLFLTSHGIPGEELQVNQDPLPIWVSVNDGTRTPPDIEDRAAKFLPHQNSILTNADFRVFTDMTNRWMERYSHVPGARPVVEQIVREWFEQQLVEAVLGAQALKGSRHWTIEEMDHLWSEEALTAVVLPRYHVDHNIKRALGAKLGTLKDRVA